VELHFQGWPAGGKLHFKAPSAVFEAWTAEAVGPTLAAAEAARRQGAWLAGFACYELGLAFEPKLAEGLLTDPTLPLFAFGAFDGPAPWVLDETVEDAPVALGPLTPAWSLEDYGEAFRALHDAIVAGELYQGNLTFPLSGPYEGSPRALFKALAARQAVPFGVLVERPKGPMLLSRSPELFFRTDGEGGIEAKPMKGTAPRHPDPERDAAARTFLAEDLKNRAENLMIVDLLRNDLGKLCTLGSVRGEGLFAVESFATVHQMTSLVRGQLKAPPALGTLLRALFPCGSITGAPKFRAMETLQALESGPRGIYCGTLGWMAPDGRSEFNVAIRTLALDEGQARLAVGSGVVYDSVAEAEYEEALWKARFATLSPETAP
jgi:para-aminobenzoate synthetase component 1